MIPAPDEVADGLRRLGIDSTAEPVLVANGWESRVFRCESDRGTVAARVFADPDPERARHEAGVMRTLGGLGYPVPAIHGLGAVAGSPLVVMTFVDGPNLWEAAWPDADVPELCARLLARLHALPVTEVTDDPLRWLRVGARRAADAMPRFEPYVVALSEAEPRDIVVARCHLDFHPGNVLWDGSPWVIDWTGARVTDRRLDLAWSRLLAEMYAPGWAAWFSPDGDDRWFEGAMALRRLVTVAEMLATGRHAAGEGLVDHLEAMRVPAAWLEGSTGVPVPSVTGLLYGDTQSARR